MNSIVWKIQKLFCSGFCPTHCTSFHLVCNVTNVLTPNNVLYGRVFFSLVYKLFYLYCKLRKSLGSFELKGLAEITNLILKYNFLLWKVIFSVKPCSFLTSVVEEFIKKTAEKWERWNHLWVVDVTYFCFSVSSNFSTINWSYFVKGNKKLNSRVIAI